MSQPAKITNPFTGRKIKHNGPTHRKLMKCLDTIEDILVDDHIHQEELKKLKKLKKLQKGGGKKVVGKVGQELTDKGSKFFEQLVKKSAKYNDKAIKTAKSAVGESADNVTIPKSKYHLISSAMPPDPQQHSWYHHHAPFSQNFGAYVCLKRDTLQELGTFMRDALLSDIKN